MADQSLEEASGPEPDSTEMARLQGVPRAPQRQAPASHTNGPVCASTAAPADGQRLPPRVTSCPMGTPGPEMACGTAPLAPTPTTASQGAGQSPTARQPPFHRNHGMGYAAVWGCQVGVTRYVGTGHTGLTTATHTQQVSLTPFSAERGWR